MEKFDFEEEPVVRRGPQLSRLDLLTALVLLVTLAIGGFMGYVFFNPKTPLNPLVPKIPTAFVFPSVTITPLQPESTWTPTLVVETETPTLAPTITLQPSPTFFSLVPPSKTPPPSPAPQKPYGANVTAIDSTIIHPDLGCAWLGVGGSVVDASNAPVLYMTLRLSGYLNGSSVDRITVSGTALDYGQSGFEFQLGTAPVGSVNPLSLQLLNQSGVPQANTVYVVTYNDCKKNLILVRFKKSG